MFGCWQRAFAGLECSQGGAYLHCNSNEFRAGVVVLGHRRGLGVGGDVGMLATPRNRSVWGENPSPRGGGEGGGTEEIQGK